MDRETFNDPIHNPPSSTPAEAFGELPEDGRIPFLAFLDRLEELLGHGVDADWFEHPNPEDGTAGELEVQVHAIHFANPSEDPWLLTLKGTVYTDPDLAPDWTWAWDSADSDEMLWETAPELNGWGWPGADDAVDVLALLDRQRAAWDDGLAGLHTEEK
ncbi:hypothetical protein ABZ234_03510 [Nocardiopsis sp. NPDC006198]|uniref:hypothetical protein n=1 Tax=Nocardiopsis sp. NPDC006198 TaxID=3154472 RepID=UPI0033B68974